MLCVRLKKGRKQFSSLCLDRDRDSPHLPREIVEGELGPVREEVTGVWRRLHNEELHKLYASPNIYY